MAWEGALWIEEVIGGFECDALKANYDFIRA